MPRYKFKEGDYVKCVRTNYSAIDQIPMNRVGRIIRLRKGDTYPYLLRFLDINIQDRPLCMHIYKESELELATEDEAMAELI